MEWDLCGQLLVAGLVPTAQGTSAWSGAVLGDLHSSRSHPITHSHMECESCHLPGSPCLGTQPQPVLLLEPTVASWSLLMGQG